MMGPALFVITPFGHQGSPERQEADAMLGLIQDVAGGTYEVIPSGTQFPSRISDAELDALRRDPIVVAYLGSERHGGWSPTVMFEVGYRLATSKPLVLVAHEGDAVPFDLEDARRIEIPPASSLPYRLHLPADRYAEVTDVVREAIHAATAARGSGVNGHARHLADVRP